MKPPDDSGPEARWPVLLAVIGLGGVSLALPDSLILGPRWLFLVLVAVFVVPAFLAHRAGHHKVDRVLGFALSIVVTLALVGSLGLLLFSLPRKAETPAALLRSAAALWITNVLVFALWYWRLDAGGPHERDGRRGHTAGAFFFPQMMQGAPSAGG